MDPANRDRRDRVKSAQFVVDQSTLDPEPEVDLARKAEAEQALRAAEQALQMTIPDDREQEEEATQYLPAGARRRAPLAGKTRISPANVEKKDGRVPFEDLPSRLRKQTRQLLRTGVEVEVDIPTPRRKVIITYEFDDPIREVENASGELYVVYNDTQKVPFQAGQTAERIVQVLTEDDFGGRMPVIEKEAVVNITGQQANWTLTNTNDS